MGGRGGGIKNSGGKKVSYAEANKKGEKIAERSVVRCM